MKGRPRWHDAVAGQGAPGATGARRGKGVPSPRDVSEGSPAGAETSDCQPPD